MQERLTISAKKSNFVIFTPSQKKLDYRIHLSLQDNTVSKITPLECKGYVKFLGVLVDKNLTWKHHPDIDIYIVASKTSKIVGVITQLGYHIPLNTPI